MNENGKGTMECGLGCEEKGKGETQKKLAFRRGECYTFIILKTFSRGRYSLIFSAGAHAVQG